MSSVLGEGAAVRVIHVLRKPLSEGTVASNVLKHGTGGLNIDASRIPSDGSHMVHGTVRRGDGTMMADRSGIGDGPGMFAPGSTFTPTNHAGGRWPANVILQHLDGCRCDGVKRVKGVGGGASSGDNAFGQGSGWNAHQNRPTNITRQMDKDGKETVANWICAEGCPVARLDEQSGALKSGVMGGMQRGFGFHGIYGSSGKTKATCYADVGGASRFYKQIGGSGEEP